MSASRPLPLLRHSLRESWRSLIAWAVGLVAALSLYLPLFSSIGGNASMQDLIKSLPHELTAAIGYDNISTGSGYTQSTFFGLLGFVLVVIAGTGWGTAALASDEERGTLELTLAHGVTRTQVILERAASIALRFLALGAIVWGVIAALNGPSNLDLNLGNVGIAVLGLCGLGMLAAAASLTVGSIVGRRSIALMGGAGISVIAYVLNAVASQSDTLSALKDYSPYAWAYRSEPLVNGWDGSQLWLLYSLIALLLVIALAAFNRRDVGA
ncbi:ABC transporter permease subunit [Lysinibacter cavernae]|uniref:ABC-2 type transport system permease protein n=1 Tax=Lysinibacter cavernae TaxID=1640652 RepID=A0A7X5R063_9MICO|nr:ABC transporter permease subunit [Lysinibacter cavernae]NIH53208.1 ABC-2 type transport system permease protein [Lysinibacter cavernae]